MTKIIFGCLFFSILLIALELLFIWIVLLIGDRKDEDSPKEEEKENECEHEYEFLCFDNTCMGIGIVKGIYRCRKCGKIISI